ncbi:DUF3921 family protein [Litchfieldia alkalitelluris]|uniref:DUF3921 family protein n=1 Tax=Litchfieldia alkalitelluris TaxID=304268 RepID=UPI001115C0DE|nr:DUF3921 family protein [Litchfieldia alkalitelluris]
MNHYEFDKISKALQVSNQALQEEGIENELVQQAQDELLQALSHATSVEKDYLVQINK